ncbi:TPA: hypothetical protein ACLH5A_000426 [Yersinia enterocolitica]|nr:hypothetical protein [Yersinia enterocolitica]ELZ4048427.1 hypothetical protein [Yersinia enterocolitica]HDL7020289.1 hypothetical protein [Yersinia enterocolitica]HDL7917561.1 hypothetical protein [Yersinia enterocolitica]HDV5954632.1 hypothetical protein [Yersinia enterocolitica]
MNEKPILFNAEMVNAILSGRKTQTRRIMKVQPAECNHTHWPEYPNPEWKLYDRGWNCAVCGNGVSLTERDVTGIICPLGKPGDRLWVREAFAAGLCTESTLAYRATHKTEDLEEGWGETIKWTPSIHMPRWASRINLLITGVRVERLQDISDADASAEGCKISSMQSGECLSDMFARLWKSIYGDESWQANPWVWVINFERMEAK